MFFNLNDIQKMYDRYNTDRCQARDRMTIYAGHLRELILLFAAIVIFAESTLMPLELRLLWVGFTAIVMVFHLGHMWRAAQYPEEVQYVD